MAWLTLFVAGILEAAWSLGLPKTQGFRRPLASGIVIALIFIGLPFVVRTLQPVMEEIDREVEEAAATLGASRFRTLRRVILPTLLNPFGVYLMCVYARDAVPDELLDAARVDGAGEFRTFFQVALPMLRPAVVTVLLLSVVSSWNNYFLPLAMLSDNRLFPVTVGIGLWQSTASTYGAAGGQSLWSIIILGSLDIVLGEVDK